MRILNLLTNYLVRRLYILSQNNQNPCIKSSNRLYFYSVEVSGSAKLSLHKKSNWKTGLFLDCTCTLKYSLLH